MALPAVLVQPGRVRVRPGRHRAKRHRPARRFLSGAATVAVVLTFLAGSGLF